MNSIVDSNPYQTPAASEGIDNLQSYKPEIFSTKGRIGRLRYLAYSMIYNIIIMFVIGILSAIMVPVLASGGDPAGSAVFVSALMMLIYVPAIAIFFIVARRRLHDLNRSGWLSLLIFVPLLNMLFGLYLLFWPGSPEANDYGPAPEANSALEIIIGLAAPIAISAMLAAVAIPAYQGYIDKAQQLQQKP